MAYVQYSLLIENHWYKELTSSYSLKQPIVSTLATIVMTDRRWKTQKASFPFVIGLIFIENVQRSWKSTKYQIQIRGYKRGNRVPRALNQLGTDQKWSVPTRFFKGELLLPSFGLLFIFFVRRVLFLRNYFVFEKLWYHLYLSSFLWNFLEVARLFLTKCISRHYTCHLFMNPSFKDSLGAKKVVGT